jgi:hypothetical protein
MAENFEQLQATLVELHDQLANTRQITPELRALLAGLATDIERILADQAAGRPPSAAPASSRVGQRESLIARLSDAAREFEGTHPNLSGTIGSIIDALGQMGV